MSRRIGGDQYYLVRNFVSGESVKIVPGALDGQLDKFGKGDLWFLKYKATEIDDSGGSSSAINIDPFVNGESINGTDFVVWYGGHWKHEHFDAAPDHGDGPSYCGPDLILQGF
jgi:hypothetical protein